MSATQDTSPPPSAAACTAGSKIAPKRKTEVTEGEVVVVETAEAEAADRVAVSPKRKKEPRVAVEAKGEAENVAGSGVRASAPATGKKPPKSARKTTKEERRSQPTQPLDVADIALVEIDSNGCFTSNYGNLPIAVYQSPPTCPRSWTDVHELVPDAAGRTVLVRGWVHAIRRIGSKITFVVLRDGFSTVQCVLVRGDAGIDEGMLRFVRNLPKESIVRVEGTVCIPSKPVQSATQKVELSVEKIYCISRPVNQLPFHLDDATRSYKESIEAENRGEKLPHVALEIRLNNRTFDLRTPANRAIFVLQSAVESEFNKLMSSKGFLGTHTPKITPGVSEGGSAVFKLSYTNGQIASLAQSPQLYKQMLINGGLKHVFEVGAVYRAEKSNTHRHLCEYIGMHAEMEIREHYFEVIDVVEFVFVRLFDHLSENFETELEIIRKQHPFEPLKYPKTTLRLKYSEGIEMLKDVGFQIELFDDLNTQAEKKLGQIVRKRYGTDFFILYEYPLALRPFYTMPCSEGSEYSNSFDAFIRGEEVLSGSQRIHSHGLLLERIGDSGINQDDLEEFTRSFCYGSPPRGGFGVGLERFIMLYCGLPDIRMASLFPRDPNRLTP